MTAGTQLIDARRQRLVQAVVGSALNPKEGGKAFQKMIKEMTSG